MFTPTLLVLWLFNFNIYFCGGYSAHNRYPGHCFRLSPSHRNLLTFLEVDLLHADASEWGVSQSSRERTDNSYLSKSETLRQKQRKTHQVLRRRRNQKTWGEVEKASWENKVRRDCFVCKGWESGKMYPRSRSFLKPQTFKNLWFLPLLQLKKNPKASAKFSFVCLFFYQAGHRKPGNICAVSYEFTVYLLFLSRLWNYLRLLVFLLPWIFLKRGRELRFLCNRLHSALSITVCHLSYLGLRLSWTLQANEFGGQEAQLALTTTNSTFLGKDSEHGVVINLLYYKVPRKSLLQHSPTEGGILKSTWILQGPPLAGVFIF